MKYLKHILMILGILSFSIISAQGNWEVFTKEKDGLISGSVKKLFEDSKGNIWALTTVWGVMKYDGETWTNYTKDDGLIAKDVTTIFEDSNGNIWLGGYGKDNPKINGLMKFNGTSFEVISRIATNDIIEDATGNIWLGHVAAPSYYNGEQVTSYTKKSGHIPTMNINKLYYSKNDNTFWISTRKGLTSFNGSEWKQYPEESGAPTKKVKDLLVDNDGTLWVTSKFGIHRFDGTNWSVFSEESGLVSEDILSLYEDNNSNIWAISGKDVKGTGIPIADLISAGANAASKSGLMVYKDGKWKTFGDDPGSPSNRVIKIFEERDGTLWFDTFTVGFHKYDGTTWESFRRDEGFKSNHWLSIFEDSKENIWVGLGSNGLGKYDGDNWSFYNKESGLPSNRIFSIIEDKNGNIWFGSFKGIIKYTP